tara:strand:- start:1177 stop:1407 length:231 start_codon:yes stop_codon:yes gene_type:complete
MTEVYGDEFRDHVDLEKRNLNNAISESLHIEKDGDDLTSSAKRRRLTELRPHAPGECPKCDDYKGNPTPVEIVEQA